MIALALRFAGFAGLIGMAIMCGFGSGVQISQQSLLGALVMAAMAGFFGWFAYKMAFGS